MKTIVFKLGRIQKIVKRLIGEGWIYSRRRKHGQLRSPTGEVFTLSLTPRLMLNYRKLMTFVRRLTKAN